MLTMCAVRLWKCSLLLAIALVLGGTLPGNAAGQDAATAPSVQPAGTFLPYKLPKVRNEYDAQFLDEFAVGSTWPLQTYRAAKEDDPETLGHCEVVQDVDPARGKVIQMTVKSPAVQVKLVGYNIHTQIPSEFDAITFWAKLAEGSEPVTVLVGHDTRRVPGSWFTRWDKPVTIDSREWKKYVVTLDGQGMRMSHHRTGKFGFPTDAYTCDFTNEIIFSMTPKTEGTVFLDDGGFEAVADGRKGRGPWVKGQSPDYVTIKPIENFESGIERLGKNTPNNLYQQGNWAYSGKATFAERCTTDAAAGKQSARIVQGAHEGDNMFEVETGPAPEKANAFSFHIKVLDWRWMKLVKNDESDARQRYAFYIYAVVWTVPAANQPRMAGAKGHDLYAAEGFRWAMGNQELVDVEGKAIPRAMYVVRAKVDAAKLDQWQQFVIPFREFTYVWGLEKSLERPIDPKDIYHVGVYAGAKDMGKTVFLLDEMSFGEVKGAEAPAAPQAQP